MWEYRARWVNTVDGDTIDVVTDLGFGINGMAMRLRLLGVDTPERNEPGYAEATAFTHKWLSENEDPKGRVAIATVRSTHDIDKADSFGRYLAVVWNMAKTECLNEALLTGGYAKVYTK